MKTYISLFILLLFASKPLQAQFALEQTYSHSLTVTRINDNEYKYFLMDVAKSECRLYNLDHSLWKTIPISLPVDYYLYDIKFVTQTLFNSDSNIELWYSAYKWIATTTDGYYQHLSKIISETGTTLATITGGTYAYIQQAGTDVYKLNIYAYDNSFYPGSVKTYVYALPGSATILAQTYLGTLDPYPNPAVSGINIPLPEKIESGKLLVYTASGQLKCEQDIQQQEQIHLHTSEWTPGVYTYRIVGSAKTIEPKKFIVKP
ncbi:MAG: T9SS type A sorting domain-containing protein [Bacteroidales bacterium]|nr:T9SS type A sorting domain-containing protein [Bacteroidales bacterium]MDD4770013.1 T9SS type A sorting domain-containing protein [Bacteroidales bacterium]